MDAPTYTREKIVFTGGRGERVPAWLMLPKVGAHPFPVALVLDGWMGGKDRWWEDDTWPRGGLLTKALAARAWPRSCSTRSSTVSGTRASGYRPVEEHVCGDCLNSRREMIVETVVDYRRALDYLATRAGARPGPAWARSASAWAA